LILFLFFNGGVSRYPLSKCFSPFINVGRASSRTSWLKAFFVNLS
jgi:hypothetical protein